MPTPRLELPYIETAQAQKEVTHAEALNRLDALVQAVVEDRDLATPPVSPVAGAAYIVAASPTGAWAGKAGTLAQFIGTAWQFHTPAEGWKVWVKDEDMYYRHDGAAWVAHVHPADRVSYSNTTSGLAATTAQAAIDALDSRLDTAETAKASLSGATFTGVIRVPSYTVATVPLASPAGGIIHVTNETGGAVLAFSDGTSWRRVTDRAVVA